MKAVIVGVDGQDGSILKKYLKDIGWQVFGINRKFLVSEDNKKTSFSIYNYDLVSDLVYKIKPAHIYYLAGFHHSSEDSFTELDIAQESYKVHFLGLINFLEAIRKESINTRLFYAGSSLMYGSPKTESVTEETPFMPECIYGITKLSGYHAVRMYKELHKIFAVTGIMFNHESYSRKVNFLSKKIIKTCIEIKMGLRNELIIGDLSAKTDWGYALDYIRAMYMMLSAEEPEDYIISSGELHSVKEFVEVAFSKLGMDYKVYLKEDKSLLKRKKRAFFGDNRKIVSKLGWKPTVTFSEMIEMLVEEELKNG